jgi:hypothetical protein
MGVTISVLGNQDTARLRHTLDPGSYVDRFTLQIVSVDHDVARVDPDPEVQAALLGNFGVLGRDLSLGVYGAADSLDRADKLGDHAVAGTAEHAPLMAFHALGDYCEVVVQPGDRKLFRLMDMPAVANHVSRQDGRKFSIHQMPTRREHAR